MKTIKLVSRVFLIFSIVYFAGSCDKNFAQTTSLNKKIELSSPEIALSEFWRAAYQGDEERLIEVSPFSEINVFDRCPKEELPSPIEFVSYGGEKQVSYNKDTTLPFSSDDLTNNIKIFARYIYANKVNWNRFKVIDEKFYNDEALLKVGIADYRNNFSKGEQYAFAFKKERGEWKLIRATQLFQTELTYENIEYASPQSCN